MNSSTPAPARRAATDRASPAQRHRGGPPPPAAADELPTFTLTFKPNGTFEPATLEVPAGRFKIELINESNEPVEFESIPLRKEKVLGPGVKSFVVITISVPASIRFR